MTNTTHMQDKTTLGISDTFREYIEALVEEVVINGAPFEAQKKWLRKNSEAEGVDYEALERNLNDFIEIIKEWHELHTKSSEMMARMLAKECHLSETVLQALFDQVPRKVKTSTDVHEYVDLGLPSGTLWATCNIGASKPEDYGDYFAWGETRPKRDYGWSTYKYSSVGKLTKYTQEDSLTVLRSEDDAATTNWGTDWHTPTEKEWKELIDNTQNTKAKWHGVKGRLFTASNGNSLFFPAGGGFWNDELCYVGNYVACWSSSVDNNNLSTARYYYGDLLGCDNGVYFTDRYRGVCVRPVRSSR